MPTPATATAASHVRLRDVDGDIALSVRREQMKMLFEATASATFAATGFAVALVWHLRGTVPDETLTTWLIAKGLIALPRVVHGLLFNRRRDESLMWMHIGKLLLLLDGLVWGAAGVFLMPAGDIATMTVIVATLSGVAAIATFVLHADWEATVAYVAPMLLPCIVYFFWRGDHFGLYGGAAIGVYLVLLLAVSRRSERHVVELLILRFTNARLTSQLSSALYRAHEQSRTRDIFVANMSHELRTPLHGILGLSRILHGQVPRDLQESVGLIRRSGEHLLGLINNVLEFSRFEAHGIDLHEEEVDITRVIDDATALCMPAAVDKRLQLSCDLDLPAPYVARVDPFRLRQILLNLIGNAVKFTEQGHVHVRASERPGNGPGSEGGIVIVVEDSGVGMNPDVVAHLYEPFVQGDTSARRRYAGTGLGLNITRAVCHQMGGEISCTSAPGQGSTFTVSLPLQRIVQRAAAPARATRPQPLAPETLSATVLLAEDNDVNALVAEFSLRRLGVEVRRAVNGTEVVLHMCTTQPRPDLVLLDCQMPVMDGFDAARAVRACEARHALPRVPIVALTANVFQVDRERCREAGMDAFLGKPFADHQLRELLHLFLVPTEDDSGFGTLPQPAYAVRVQ